MAFLIDFNYQIEDFSMPDSDLYGECEDCGRITAEWQLDQCQYGFCGRFSCRSCGFRCIHCRDFNPRSVALCRVHSNIAFPFCNDCNKQYCDECTDIKVRKCDSCLNDMCNKCLEKDASWDSKSSKCGKCNNKPLRSLQEICRTTIRSSIATVQENTIPKDINKNVQHLPLPNMVKNFVCFK